MIEKILLCTDGEEGTRKAEEHALFLAKSVGAALTGLHVVDPFLKKFTNEIYAVNRDECREHLDRRLLEEGTRALEDLERRAREAGVPFSSRIRHGDPEEEILLEMGEGGFDLVIMGSKLLKGWRQRFESVNLPRKIFDASPVPVLFVR